MTARTVTGKTVLPSGSAQTSQTVTFVKRSTTISGITVTQASPPITATTNSSGEFSASLDCPADGSTQWTIIYPDGGEFDFTLPYGDGSSVAVTTLISAATVDADAVTLLLDGYEPDLGNPGTSGHVLSSTTAGVRSWVAQSGGGAVDSVFGRTGAVVAVSGDYSTDDISDDSDYAKANLTAVLNSIAQTDANQDADIADKQDASAKLTEIAALTWAANSILWLTGTATASVQALAAHIVTFLQSATAADARTAIGAGTGNGDVVGPASSVDNAIARYDSTTGKLLQGSAVTVDDVGNLDIPGPNTVASYSIKLNTTTLHQGSVNLSSNVLRIMGLSGVSLAFYADSAERARVTNTGIGIGVTANQGRIHSYDTGGGFLHVYKSGVVGSATTVIPDAAGDVTLCLSGTFTISDGAGNTAGGVITKTAPGGTFNLYDDGGTNTCQLQISAGGAVTVIRTAGARTYAVNLNLNWM